MPPPPAVTNQGVNKLLVPLLRSPLHGLVSRGLLLITVTGRRTGRKFTIPVSYRERDGVVRIGVGAPAGKQWWRNLREPAPVTLRLRGRDRAGIAVARGDAKAGVTVEVTLE
jgi:hypothetical protein